MDSQIADELAAGPPVLNPTGGQVSSAFDLEMTAASGTIYYTLDGKDPYRPVSSETATGTIVAENADKKAFVPIQQVSDNWKGGGVFDDSAWTQGTGSPGGVGYERRRRDRSYDGLISLDVEAQMYLRNTTCYIRIQFAVEGNPDDLDSMTLNVRYNDGFIAYLNGVEVARRNFDGTPTWNSTAGAARSSAETLEIESIDISTLLGVLQPGDNVLAIHGLNISAEDADFLISAELIVDGSGFYGGDLPGAIQYDGPITLDHSTQVKARILTGSTWSALNDAAFSVGPVADNLRITEIMYNPQDADEEFVELRNIGAETINLNLVSFTNGIDFTFPSLEVAAGEYVVIVRDRNAFQRRYGTTVDIVGQYAGKLGNGGERIRLQNAIGWTILDFSYKDGWRSITDGDGFSLTIIDPTNAELSSWNEKDSWRASAHAGGSPGQDDSGIVPNPGAVAINELLAHSHDSASDWIELYNTTGAAIDIGGWFLSDSKNNLTKYEIANGTMIGADEYVVFHQNLHFDNASDPGCHEPFALSEDGEQLYLSSAYNGALTSYRNVEDFGASATGVSFGRYYKTSTDNYNFVAMDHITQGSANANPKVGPIIVSEIMYNPDWPAGGSYTSRQYEYVELHNISAEPVTLYDYDKVEPWKFTDGIEFTFPDDLPVEIPAGGYLLVVKNPAAFSWRYPTVPIETILGPYDGKLSDAGERLELSMPGDLDRDGKRYYIRIDRINYTDGSHPEDNPGSIDLWPMEPDGYGKSLTRKVLTDYGNDPDNWTAAVPSPGD
jgi:hypothetical protein